MSHEPVDTREDLPEEALHRVAFGQLADEVPDVPNEAAAGLERALLQARQRPALDGERQDEPTRERPGRLMLPEVRIEVSESLLVRLLREDARFERMQGGRKRDTAPGHDGSSSGT